MDANQLGARVHDAVLWVAQRCGGCVECLHVDLYCVEECFLREYRWVARLTVAAIGAAPIIFVVARKWAQWRRDSVHAALHRLDRLSNGRSKTIRQLLDASRMPTQSFSYCCGRVALVQSARIYWWVLQRSLYRTALVSTAFVLCTAWDVARPFAPHALQKLQPPRVVAVAKPLVASTFQLYLLVSNMRLSLVAHKAPLLPHQLLLFFSKTPVVVPQDMVADTLHRFESHHALLAACALHFPRLLLQMIFPIKANVVYTFGSTLFYIGISWAFAVMGESTGFFLFRNLDSRVGPCMSCAYPTFLFHG